MLTLDARLYRLVVDLGVSIVFCTRLPLGYSGTIGGEDIARASWAFPVAGVLVGAVGALAYAGAYSVGLPALPAAALALAATVVCTGALHEDGLADTVDGFGGGKDRDHKLAIMRDSCLGAYGGCALALSFLLRWSALATLADPQSVALSLIAAHASARAPLAAFMRFIPPARSDGLSAQAGRPSWIGAVIAVGLGAAALLILLGPLGALVGLIALTSTGAFITWLTTRQIGGQTGDVVGALEQVNEMVILLVAAVLLASNS